MISNRLTFSPLPVLVALLAAMLALSSAAHAEPGFQPPRGGNAIVVLNDGPYFDGAFRPDGYFDILYGNSRTWIPGSAKVRSHVPYTNGAGEREGNFGTYLDALTLQESAYDNGVIDLTDAKIATDDAGNSVAAWATICGNQRCVKATVRPAGGSWSTPKDVAPGTSAADYSAVHVAIHDGMPAVAFEAITVADGPVRGTLVLGDMDGEWLAPIDLLPAEVPSDPGGGGRHMQALEFDESGGLWGVMASYDNGPKQASLHVARRAPSGAWSRYRVDGAPFEHFVDNNGMVGMAFGGDRGVIAWSRYALASEHDEAIVVVECSISGGTCGAPQQLSAAGVDGTNPRVAVDADGNAIVNWLQVPDTGGYSLVSRYGEAQEAGLAWSDDEVLMPGTPTFDGVSKVSDPGGMMHDVAFTADGTAIAAWRWNTWVEFQQQRRTFGAQRAAGAESAWTVQPIDNVVSDANGLPRLRIATDAYGDAAVMWPRENGPSSYLGQVAPFDNTGPRIRDLQYFPTITAGTAVGFTVDVLDTWSAVDDDDIVWFMNGNPIQQKGRLIVGCFLTPGTTSFSVEATDAAGNVSTTDTFTFEVFGTESSCTGAGPDLDPDPDPDPNNGHDTGTHDGGSGSGGTPPPVVITPKPDAPQPFVLTDTVSRDKVPAVVGLKVSTARDRLDRAGINADFDIRMITRAKAPKGIAIGEVMAQTPKAGTKVTTGIRSAADVKLEVYVGPPAAGKAANRCSVAKVSAAVKGLEFDLAKLMMTALKCPYQVNVKPVAAGTDAVVTGAATSKAGIVLTANVPKLPKRNDLFLNFRENPNGISFEQKDWTLTAGQPNAFTFQVVDRGFRLVQKAKVTLDVSGVGIPKNISGQTDATGEKITVLTPQRAGVIDILVELPGADGQSIWGVGQVKVVDRSSAKVGTTLTTVSGRVFQKSKSGSWLENKSVSKTAAGPQGKFINIGGMLSWMSQLVAPLGDSIRAAFAPKAVSPEQTLATALRTVKVSPAQLALAAPLVGGNVEMARITAGQVVAAGGGNVVAAGGGNVIAAGGANVVAAGGGNVVAAGGGNVVAAGGLNLINAAGSSVIAAGGGNVIAAGGGNVIAAGGGNVIAAGGGNLLSDNGLGRKPGS